MRIAVVGTGYVGLVSAACFAELGHDVFGVDIDAAKVAMLKQGISPIYEPGLEELIKRNLAADRLRFTTELTEVLPHVQIVFSAVATPPGEGYRADLRAVFAVAETVATHVDHDIVFVNKSTVPVGTGKKCEDLMANVLRERGVSYDIPVVSNPEFLREGLAVQDTMMPDRIVVGHGGGAWAQGLMEELYRPITRIGKPLLQMSRESAEIVKYAANAFLATKISFINMTAEFAEAAGGNVREIAAGLGLDDRIGPRFLHAGIGYGGSCFPKDVRAWLATAQELGVTLPIVEATHEANLRTRERFLEKVLKTLPAKATVAVWGLSFKPKTDDLREAPSLEYVQRLIDRGHSVQVFDPAAMEKAKPLLPAEVTFCDSPLAAAKDADALMLVTEWDEFRGVDLGEIRKGMKGVHLFDGRNVYDPKEVRAAGFTYHGIGMPPLA